METVRAGTSIEEILGLDLELPFSAAKREILERNLRFLVHDVSYQERKFSSSPLLLEFSVNDKCQLRCVMCPAPEKRNHELPEELVRDVLIEQLFPPAVSLMPSSGSEPFLGDLDLLVDGCLKHEVQLNLVTNGLLITRDRLEHMAPAIGRMQLSVDGHTAELYESIRLGGKHEKVVENTRIAAEIARREGFRLLLSTVFSRGLAHAMADYVRFAGDLGADVVAFQAMHHTTAVSFELDAFRYLTASEVEKEKEKAIRAAEEAEIDVHFEFVPPHSVSFNRRLHRPHVRDLVVDWMLKQFPDMCYMSASYTNVQPDSSVHPCCAAGDVLVMGNLGKESAEEIWNGERYQELRGSFFKQELLEHCRGCSHLQAGNRLSE